MGTLGRWVIRILLVAFGLFILVSFAVTALRSTSTVAVVGNLSTGIGLFGLYTTYAVRFRDWSALMEPFRRTTGEPWGFRAGRRAQRQINGVEPYRDDEIASLRRLAQRRAASTRPSSSVWIVVACVVLFMVGIGLAPPRFPAGAQWEMIFRIGAVVVLVMLAVAVVAAMRRRTDAKAEAFLERTQPV
jgi:hypothetical protein